MSERTESLAWLVERGEMKSSLERLTLIVSNELDLRSAASFSELYSGPSHVHYEAQPGPSDKLFASNN